MAKPLAVDNSKLKEQARQRRQEQARLQQVTEKQPTKALFGPPIPVSRPNDPTFNKLSDWFGPYEIGAYRPFFSPNNDSTPSCDGVDRRQADNSRHGDTVRHNDASRHGDNVRPGDNRHSDARHVDATRQRHGDNRNSDNRNSHAYDNTTRNSRGSGAANAALVPSGEIALEASRQGVFDQFVKSNSNAPARDNAQALLSSDGRNSNKTVRHAKPPDLTTGVRQSLPNDKMRNKTTSIDRPRPDRVEESSVIALTNSSVAGSRPDGPKLGVQPSKSFSTPLQSSPPLLDRSSPLPNNGARDARSDVKNSACGHGSDPHKDYEKTSRIAIPVGRVNGSVRSVYVGNARDVDLERKLTLNIPPLHRGDEKFDDFFAKLRQEVDIPLPLTAIMTPKKTDGSTFPFPAVLPESLRDHDVIIPNDHLPEDEEDGDEDEELQQQLPVLSHAHLQAPVDAPTNVLVDLILSSDSEEELEKETGLDQRSSSPSRPPDKTTTTSPGPADHTRDPGPDSSKSRHTSVSSLSSEEEESCSSDSESDSSQSENEGDRPTQKPSHSNDEDDDENEDKQPKRPSWEISNFIPKSNEQVPFIPGLMSSSSSSPLANRQLSPFDNDTDPLKRICSHVLSAHLSPLPITESGIDHLDESYSFPTDITDLLSPSKDPLQPWGLPQIDITPPTVVGYKPTVVTPGITPSSTSILGVDYCDGKPSVIVRICRSRLSTNSTKVGIVGGDSIDADMCVALPRGTDSASDVVSCKGIARTNCKGTGRAETPSERVECSAEPSAADVKMLSVSSRTLTKRSSDVSPVRTLAAGSLLPVPCSPSLPPSIDARSSVTAADSKEARTEKSPRKLVGSDRKEETYLSTAKGAKRKAAEDGLGRPDQKKLCERSNSKEDRKSQNLPQNGEVDRTKGSRLPEPTNNRPKSPVLLTVSEDSSSRSSSSQKRNEKLKSQNGYSKIDEKLKKVAAAATTPCSDGSRNASVAESSIVSLDNPAKTPMVNGVGESPAYQSIFDANESVEVVTPNRKRSAPCAEDDQPLDRRKEPVNGIKRPERLESSDFYLQQARKLKHEGDSWLDKFSKALSYIESVLAFISHCSVLEQEHAETAKIQKMYQETMGLCQYIIRVIENVTNVEKHYLLVISLRIQSVICLKLYGSRKIEIAKLKTILDEHNKIPSPYQASHHHSANATTAPGSWNHANGGTPSPHSPRPSPSPAGSIGSVGSAGSSNGDSSVGGMGKPPSSSLVNGHSMSSIVVPQRIHSVMMNYLSHTNHLYQCHESWDQADSILLAQPAVGEFFHSLDVEYGPIDLHSSTLALVRYASEVVCRVRNNARRLTQATRTD